MILINNKEFSKLRFLDIEKFLCDYDEDESFFIELKNNNITTKDLIKEICAFSNTYGGYVLLGVEDNKDITGCIDWTEEKINNAIRNLMSPTPLFDIKKLTSNNKKIFIIRIEEGNMPPYVTNKGIIYERISSSSFPIKDSSSINRMMEKRKDNIKKIENKLYISKITENVNNLCAYLDFGFSVSSRNISNFTQKLLNANYEKISDILKKSKSTYSISKVGYSICITIGDVSYGNEHVDLLVPAGLNNFMEILPDGSVRGRIVLTAPAGSKNINNIASGTISMMYSIFKDVYSNIFDNKYCSNFIEARCYEKLNTLKLFNPKIIVNSNDEFYDQFQKYHDEHINKYGSNTIINSNRVPMNDFFVIDKRYFQERKIKYNTENLFNELFSSSYFLLGYIEKLKITDEN